MEQFEQWKGRKINELKGIENHERRREAWKAVQASSEYEAFKVQRNAARAEARDQSNLSGKAQYDAISQEYTRLVETDPAKQFVQYPSALRLLGDVSEQSILDVGCGSGIFDRELAERGARVTGYDASLQQIATAREEEQAHPLGIDYSVSQSQEFTTDKKFDKAVSVLVLHYAEDRKNLEAIFSSTSRALKDGGEFVTILVNPRFERFGQTLYNRRFIKLDDGKMKADFFDKNGEISFSAEFSDFSADDYEQAAKGGGFVRSEWIGLRPDEAGLKQMGEEYWKDFEKDGPFIGFIAYK